MGKNSFVFLEMPASMRNDEDVVLAAVKQRGRLLAQASEDIANNKKVVLAAVQNDGRALQFASEEMKKDMYVVNAALEQNARALEPPTPPSSGSCGSGYWSSGSS